MDSLSKSGSLEHIEEEIVTNIKQEPSDLEELFGEPKLENPSTENVADHTYENIEEASDLPEGVQYYPPQGSKLSLRPTPTPSVRSLQSQRSIQSAHQWHTLSLPKCHYLEDTIERFKGVLQPRSVENLKRQLHDQKILREVTEFRHLGTCSQPPTPHPPSGRRRSVDTQKREQIRQKFNARLKRDAFDRLMDKIFTELPHIVLEADITNMSQLPPSTQQMVNVIFSTITSYTGKPLIVQDHELYCHLAVGLTRFIENVIDTVRGKVYSNVSIVGKEDGKRQLQHRQDKYSTTSMTTGLMENLTEKLVSIQRSREILKPKNSNV